MPYNAYTNRHLARDNAQRALLAAERGVYIIRHHNSFKESEVLVETLESITAAMRQVLEYAQAVEDSLRED